MNKRKKNPWAICTKSVGRKDKNKYERCVKSVKNEAKEPGMLPKLVTGLRNLRSKARKMGQEISHGVRAQGFGPIHRPAVVGGKLTRGSESPEQLARMADPDQTYKSKTHTIVQRSGRPQGQKGVTDPVYNRPRVTTTPSNTRARKTRYVGGYPVQDSTDVLSRFANTIRESLYKIRR